MRGRVVIAAQAGGALTELSSQPPLTARATIDGVTLVASAGGPLGGDTLEIVVRVGPGARLKVGSAGAMLVQPGLILPGRPPSTTVLDLDVEVAEGGCLVWSPQPTIVAAGARLSSRTRVRLDAGAELRLRDVLVLGRFGETGGAVVARLDVERAGEPVLRQENVWGDPDRPSDGPAVLAGYRVIGSQLDVGVPDRSYPVRAARGTVCAVLGLAAGGALVSALGNSSVEVEHALGAADLRA